jgi:UDPglucose 6-dehydrogenase
MKNPVIFDGRNLYEIASMEKRNFFYQSIGRKTVNKIN